MVEAHAAAPRPRLRLAEVELVRAKRCEDSSDLHVEMAGEATSVRVTHRTFCGPPIAASTMCLKLGWLTAYWSSSGWSNQGWSKIKPGFGLSWIPHHLRPPARSSAWVRSQNSLRCATSRAFSPPNKQT